MINQSVDDVKPLLMRSGRAPVEHVGRTEQLGQSRVIHTTAQAMASWWSDFGPAVLISYEAGDWERDER